MFIKQVEKIFIAKLLYFEAAKREKLNKMKIYKMLMVLENTGSTGFQIPPVNTVVPARDYSAFDHVVPSVLKAARKPFNCGPQERISISVGGGSF